MSKVKVSSTNFENKQTMGDICTEVFAAHIIGGQWTLAICCILATGKRRFTELKKLIPNITERMLTLQLRKMEDNKLVKRTVFAEVPVRVEYELTESAQQLNPILKQLEEWGKQHRKVMDSKPD